ncbi:hypothetical protein BC830DRAFT_508053 [Chytriomyces sp. MP71]|nr:hypothetical protein BC830DRAFT_508053 [Chytriomyces sp. MP71]
MADNELESDKLPLHQKQNQMIRLSPGEIARLEQEQRKAQRIARLQQVRAQTKQVERKRTDAYQNLADKEWAAQHQAAENEWLADRDFIIAQAIDSLDQRAALFGLAHTHAKAIEEHQIDENAQLRDYVIHSQMNSIQRGHQALEDVIKPS